jgi:hypothetical protein
LYSSPSIIRIIKSRRMRWAGHVARMEEKRNAYRILVGKPEGKRPLGRPRRRCYMLQFEFSIPSEFSDGTFENTIKIQCTLIVSNLLIFVPESS